MKNKKGLRLFLYALPIVAFGAAAISCFAISSVTKNNFNSNEEVQKLNARIMKIQKDYIDNPEEYTNPEGEAYEEYTLATNRLNQLTKASNGSYQVTSAIAYTASILTLVSFGVVLYVSDKIKEKEESYVEPIVDDEEKELEQLEKEPTNE